ncbi:aminopeptidase [Alkalimarinus alittae]|uniref:Aminopeptidase n=1 Tax=Alkalimarinus alittae TaxID=2961619 RepID=A0ABY6N0U6_9ALTE|nr:aminopeptidase [Alkalimarinus alittae]UZE95720.1 aminopeptidase [Alkalimarinus alittae]
MIIRTSLFTGTALLMALSAVLISLIQGCSTLTYYQQAIVGQYTILSDREDIDSLIADDATPKELKQKLETVRHIRAFSATEMQMNIGKSYAQYSDTKRDYVVWNITAAPELSLTPHQWCYPVIGCQSYRGYFQQHTAEVEANKLQQQGFDIWVGGVSAYSTLGWFNDPILNTFIYRDDSDLAALLIHELSHQVLYIKDDTAFNESFATAVELEGLRRWLISVNQAALIHHHQRRLKEKKLFIATVSDAIEKLKAIYASGLSDTTKRQQKQKIISAMRSEYQRNVINSDLSGVFTHWFDKVNNAKLITVSNYYHYVPAFTAMIAESEGDMAQFYKAVKALSKLDKASRDNILKGYLLKPAH